MALEPLFKHFTNVCFMQQELSHIAGKQAFSLGEFFKIHEALPLGETSFLFILTPLTKQIESVIITHYSSVFRM